MKSYKKIIILILLFLSVLLIKNKALALTVSYQGSDTFYLKDLSASKIDGYSKIYIFQPSNNLFHCLLCEEGCYFGYSRTDHYIYMFDSSNNIKNFNYCVSIVTADDSSNNVIYRGDAWTYSEVPRLYVTDSIIYIGGDVNLYPCYSNQYPILNLPENISWDYDFILGYRSDKKTVALFCPPQSKNGVFLYSQARYFVNSSSTDALDYDIYLYDSVSHSWTFYMQENFTRYSDVNGYLYNIKPVFSSADLSSKLLDDTYSAFRCFYEYKYFPSIYNTASSLASGNDTVLILPGDFKKTEDFYFAVLHTEEVEVEETGTSFTKEVVDYSTKLNADSLFFKNVYAGEVEDFWYEISPSEYADLLEKDKQYIFRVQYDYNDETYYNDIYATWGGLTSADIKKNEEEEERYQEQLKKIDEQTEAIKEQTETSKGIWATLKELLSYINPFSENFFVYKLIDLLIDMLIDLFVPSNEFFSDWFADLNEWLGERFGFLYYPFELVIDVLNRISELSFSDGFVLSFPDLKINLLGTETVLIKSFSYDFNELVAVSPFDTIYDFYLIAVDVILILGLIVLIKNTFVDIFGGQYTDSMVHDIYDYNESKQIEKHQKTVSSRIGFRSSKE